MAYPVSSFFGRTTYAELSKCGYCGKPYDENERWHTLQQSIGKVDIWCLVCDECFRKPTDELRGDA